MKWWQISIVLCLYGFFKEYRPSEPFISPFLNDFKNFTVEQVNEDIFPVGTYCHFALLIAIFLLTDFLRYKPVLIVGSVSAVTTWCLLIWGKSIKEMQVLEFFYGLFIASEVAYYSYIYAKVDKQYYQKVTSYTRAAFLLGKASAGLSSQILVHYNFNLLQLNYFTVFGVGITIPLAFCLPCVPQSTYFHRPKDEKKFSRDEVISDDSSEVNQDGKDHKRIAKCEQMLRKAFSHLYKDFKQAFTNLYVVKWSIWWALASCGYFQVVSYYQLLWQVIIQDESVPLYHGYFEFAASISGAAIAFGVGYLKIRWETWGEIALGILTVSQGGLLFYSALLSSVYVAYAMHLTFKLLYDAGITVATYEVAKFINEDSYGLIFGINTFLALCAQVILTVVFIDALKMNIRAQFQIYGGYHFFIGCGFLLYKICKLVLCRR